ncbi:unnamed protein product, partial [Mesorhabditis spiculigera]
MLRFLALGAVLCVCWAREDSVAVEGVLKCDGQPASGVLVKLYERDSLFDDKLASVKTDSRGHFRLQGRQAEWGGIKTKFNFYHKCGTLPLLKRFVPTCTFKGSFNIPDRYVSHGGSPSQVYDAQTIELSLYTKDTDCLHR